MLHAHSLPSLEFFLEMEKVRESLAWIYRTFAEVVALESATCKVIGRIGLTRAQLSALGSTLKETDHVIVEATENATGGL
jgi:hypothetical protein